MTEQWTQQYVRLAFHIDRMFRATGGWYVDNYYFWNMIQIQRHCSSRSG